jgi:hypothetical protein
MSATTTILHPTDFSKHSQSALALAVSMAREKGARLVLLHVVPNLQATLAAEMAAGHRPSEHFEEDMRQAWVRDGAKRWCQRGGGPRGTVWNHLKPSGTVWYPGLPDRLPSGGWGGVRRGRRGDGSHGAPLEKHRKGAGKKKRKTKCRLTLTG